MIGEKKTRESCNYHQRNKKKKRNQGKLEGVTPIKKKKNQGLIF